MVERILLLISAIGADVKSLIAALAGKQPLSTVLTNTTAAFTTTLKTKVDGIEAGAQVNTVTSVANKTGAVTLTKTDVGLSNVDNTADADKPVSTAVTTALGTKVDKVAGKGLSTEDFTTAEKTKLATLGGASGVTSVNTRTGDVVLAKADVGLENVDNTSDASKPISTLQATALAGKQPLATVLTNTTASFTTALNTKLTGIATGATANSTDATLLARGNHTGSQAISTVTGLQTALDGTVKKTGDFMSGTLQVGSGNNNTQVVSGAVEITAAIPFIDFKTNNATDFDWRIAYSAGDLQFSRAGASTIKFLADGNIFSDKWGGYLSDVIAGKQASGNYVRSLNNGIAFSWNGTGVTYTVDGAVTHTVWSSGNFDPNSKMSNSPAWTSVGTYIMALWDSDGGGGFLEPGTVVAGDKLVYGNATGEVYASRVNVGTWRLQGHIWRSPSGTPAQRTSVWLRVA